MADWMGTPGGRLRLLLFDDHVLFRNGLSRALSLEPDMDVAGEADTAAEALSVIQRLRVDVVIMNLELPGTEVFDFLGGLSDETRPRVVGLTAGVNGYQVHKLLRAGIDGLYLKRDSLSLLCEVIRRLGAGTDVLDSLWLRELLDRGQPAGADFRPLTPRECEVLRWVVKGLTSKEIAYELTSTEPAVKSVIQQLFEKTGVRSRAQLVRLAMERFADILEDSRVTAARS